MLRQLLRDILSKSVYHICLFRFFVSKTLKLVEQLHIFFLRGIAQKGKGNCFMLTQCHAGLRSWKWRRKFLVGTFCGAKIQSLNFLTSPVGPKIYHGNVGTSPVGPIIDDCSGKHAIYLRFCFTIYLRFFLDWSRGAIVYAGSGPLMLTTCISFLFYLIHR